MKHITLDTEKIESHLLDGNDEVTEITLTDRVKSIGSFAFYRCRHLEVLRLTDSVVDCYDGAIRDCSALRMIEVDIRRGSYSIVRDMLADVDAEVTFRLHIGTASGSGGAAATETEVLLVFPSFISIAEENTWARQINVAIQGSGMGYREVVMRKQIKYREYDSQFEKAAIDNTVTAAKVALARLLFPMELSPAARERYEKYLKERTRDVLLWIAGGRVLTRTEDKAMDLRAAAVAAEVDKDAPAAGLPIFAEFTAIDLIEFLTERGLVDRDEVEPALQVASERKDAELTAALMEAGKSEEDGSFAPEEDSLEEFIL